MPAVIVARVTLAFSVEGVSLPDEVPIDPLEFGEFDEPADTVSVR